MLIAHLRSAVRVVLEGLVRSPAGGLLARAAGPWLSATAVRELPGRVGALNGIRVPRAVRPAPAPTSAGSANINAILDLLDAALEVEGQVAECGVYRGATLLTAALHLERLGVDKRVYGFDSFEGFGRRIDAELPLGGEPDAHKRREGFQRTSCEEVWAKAERLGLAERVALVPGDFAESLPSVAGERFCFVHLDCDLYGSYKTCLEFFYPRLARGAVVLLDEYDDPPWPGCNRAVDEFLSTRPEALVAIERDHHRKYYFRKL